MYETKTLKKYENEQIISCDEEEFEKEENFEKKKVRSDPLNERRKDNKGTENFKDKKSSSQKQNKKIYNIITDSLEEEKKNCNNKKIRKKINSSNDFENEKNLSSHKIKQNKNENEISKKILKEQFTVGQINDNKFVIQLNKLNIISESKAIEYTFSNSFTIYRDCNLSNDNIYLEDSATSRNHARVILIEGRGFFLQDRGSSNFTYLKVNEKSKPPLEIGMELMIGFSLIKIKDIKLCLPLNGEV